METQAIREIKRPERAELTVFDRLRGRRRVNPLRETADGLGVVLDKLSASVTEVLPRGNTEFAGEDSADSDIEAGRRTRGFKLRQSHEDAAPPAAPDLMIPPSVEKAKETEAEFIAADAVNTVEDATENQKNEAELTEVLDILREARNAAADAIAPPLVMPAHERAEAQAKFKELFLELGMKRIEIISSIFSGPEEASKVADLFSLSTPDKAKAAYDAMDWMIMKFLNAGRDTEIGAASGAGSVYEGHEAAISATERLKEFLRNESPEKAFMRFREVNRSNIMGLLQ